MITGSDLDWGVDQATGQKVLLGGAIDALIFRKGGQDLASYSTLQTTGATLWAAFVAERDGADPSALTDLLTRHCWTYRGSDLADLFAADDLGQFDPHGNDRIFL